MADSAAVLGPLLALSLDEQVCQTAASRNFASVEAVAGC